MIKSAIILDYLKQLNWVDIFAAILLIRICYIAVKTGFSIEISKLLGTICAIYLACHYYIRLSNFLKHSVSLFGAEVNVLNFFVFSVLAFLGYYVVVIIRMVFSTLVRVEAVSLLNRWGAFILGIVRFCLFTSLIFFTIAISNISYLENSLSDSFSGPLLVKLAPRVYVCLWDKLMSRFMNKEAFNKEVSEVR
jgi:uncharacterized membrane protein required for colicin V production